MNRVFTLSLLAFAIAACIAAAPVRKKTKTAAGATKNAQTTTKSVASRGASGTGRNGSAVKVRYVRNRNGKLVRVVARTPPAPSYQLHPDPERYQQIQQALADKGYFKGQVNGVWGDDSVDALKRFQADQKLDNDGHLNALTLTGLGLGPKHDRDFAGPSAVSTPTNLPNDSAPKASPTTPLAPVANTTGATGPPPSDQAVK
jgi:Putative peptidoglycan binding domain